MKYKICVAIPIKSEKFNLNKQIIETALDKGPDLIELRLDYINESKFLTHSFLRELISIIPPKIPKIFTFRKKQEGGKYNLSTNERLDILSRLIEVKPDYLDIEINSESKVLKSLIDLAYDNNVQLIFSYHDFEKSITYEEIAEMLKRFDEKLKNELFIDLNKINGSIFKIILTARVFDDNLNVLNICKKLSREDKKFLCFAMGELGILSRILCVKFGSSWTYGSLEEKTAPGQIKIEKIREIHQLIFEN
ncbi:MAG: type I 3-dehydroquinate dehydratase [Candidatus Lokiarchaeota archaeon]|nr:type I 3-dehydroquinate dehydratase [Candidatus Lokiarchaeota archaeon]